MTVIPVFIDPTGTPQSFYYPTNRYRVPLGRRIRWAWGALRGRVCWIIWNFPDSETDEPKSLTVAGFEVPR